MRVSVVALAVFTAASLSTSRCSAGTMALPGSEGVQSPGLATDLPGSKLCDLPSLLPRPSSPAITRYGSVASGAMLKVLNDPSSLAAAPGTPARAAIAAVLRPPVNETETWGAGPHESVVPGASSGSPLRSPAVEDAPGSLISSAGRSSDLRAAPSSGSGHPAAGGARGVIENGGLFVSQVAIDYSSTNDARAAGRSASPGPDAAAFPGGPALPPGAYAGIAAVPRDKVASTSNRFSLFGLAFFALAVAPFALGLLRRRLI